MANIAPWDPFEDSVFNVFPALFSRPGMARGTAWTPRMDVAETEQDYRVEIEMPGIAKEAIQVSIDRNTVTVSAERREEKSVDDKAEWILKERAYGKFSRTLVLPSAVQDSGAEARYADGVLHLRLPKVATMKRLAVH
jgi:HSP20 family protein